MCGINDCVVDFCEDEKCEYVIKFVILVVCWLFDVSDFVNIIGYIWMILYLFGNNFYLFFLLKYLF